MHSWLRFVTRRRTRREPNDPTARNVAIHPAARGRLRGLLLEATVVGEIALALALLCGSGGKYLAPNIEAQAARYAVDPIVLVQLIAGESGCRRSALGAKGEIGLMQIKPGGSAASNVAPAKLWNVSVNIGLGAAHLARCLELCEGDYRGALSVYSGRRFCRPSSYSRRILGMLDAAERRAQKKARRS